MAVEKAPFLDPERIIASAQAAGLDSPPLRALLDLAQLIRDDENLCALVSAAHHAVYETRADFAEVIALADAALGVKADLLHGLFVLDSIRLVTERQAARGIPSEISCAVNARHAVAWLRRAVEASGRPAIVDWMPSWLRVVASGELYRLGRLEFLLERWEYPFRAYVNDQSEETIVLALAGISSDDDAVVGTPISPHGHLLESWVRLPLGQWRVALDEGDWVLDMHVPTEGALSLDEIRGAFLLAEQFFDQHYPERPFTAFVCDSWLFSPELEVMLGSDSNIVRWQREGYLLPAANGHESFLLFTFGARSIDPSTAPRDTRLRRAILEHLERGEELSSGVYLLLRQDLGRFGDRPYRSFAAVAAR